MKTIYKKTISLGCLGLLSASSLLLAEQTTSQNTADTQRVKSYLLTTVEKIEKESHDFVKNTEAYQNIIDQNKGDYKQAFKKSRKELLKLVNAMQENYKAMDSFGYETVEGIVAGVEKLSHFDVYLDAGVPKSEASAETPAAPVTLKLNNGQTIDQEGALFTFIVEPTLWGGNPKYVVPLDINNNNKIDPKESLPKAEILTAAAIDLHEKLEELLTTSQNWQPTIQDCFAAVITMTPTLSGYFDDWKESRYSKESSGRFSAVSRVSDMRGIMSSVAILYRAVHLQVIEKDKALAKSIDRGFDDIISFIDRVDGREKKAVGKITVTEIDELSSQAKEKADKLVPQVQQAAALLDIKTSI